MKECPWYQFDQASRLFQICEENLCDWVVQPGNTWTNIGFLITAYMVYKSSKTKRQLVDRVFIILPIGLCIGSTAFHVSLTRVGQIMDLASIYLLSAALMAFALKRLLRLNNAKTFWIYFFSLVLPILHMIIFETSGIPILAAFFSAALFIEFWLWKKSITKEIRHFLLVLGVFFSGFSLWILDIRGILCDPTNHILNAHSIWHLLCAVAVYQLYLFFKAELKEE